MKTNPFFSSISTPSRVSAVRLTTHLALLMLATSPVAFAANGTWSVGGNPSASGTWNTTATNWNGVSGTPWDLANGGTNAAIFSPISQPTVTISGTVYANSLTLNTNQNLLTTGGNITLLGSNPTVDVTTATRYIFIQSPTAWGGAPDITKTGAGIFAFQGARTLGNATVNAGWFVFQLPVTLTGTAGSPKTITVNANSDAAGLSFQNGATTFSNLSVILNAGRLDFSTQNATSTNAPVQLNNTGTNFISFGKYSNFSTGYENAVTMSGALSGSGGFTLQGFYTSTVPVASNGMLTLSSTSNSYRGDTGIQDGILRLGASNVIPDGASAGNLVMNSGTVRAGQLNLNGFNETVNGLFGTSGSFTGQIYNNANATASTLTIGGGNATSSFAGLIMNNLTGNGTVALTKIGTGTQTLSGNNTYTGATQVNAGTLFINGNQSAATGNLTVSAGAILSGTGTIGGAVNINGTLAAGNSIGTLSTGNLTIASTGVLDVELGRSGVTPVSDLTNVTGTVNLVSGADLDLTLSAGLATPVLDDIFYLIRNDSNDAVTGVFTKLNGVNTTLNEGSQFSWNSLDWKITYTADFANSSFTGGNDVAIQIVPEPTTWGLLAASLTTVMLYRRRRA